MKIKIAILLCMITGLLVLSAGVQFQKNDLGAAAAIGYFSAQVSPFAGSAANLLDAVKTIDKDSTGISAARKALLECRLRYKRISFFTAYFFASETAMYNAAPKYEVEEPELELVEPMGLQQIETLLYDEDVFSRKEELIIQAEALYSSVADLKNLLYQFRATDAQVLESLRIELIRIIALYISGYDAPLLKSGISEALESSKSMEIVLRPYFLKDEINSRQLEQVIHQSIAYLRLHQDFDSFDRMEYLTRYALPLQEQLGQFIKKLDLEINTSPYLNVRSRNIFRPDFLLGWDSISPVQRKELAQLGQQLFFDSGLSGNGKVSCASCHQPGKFFSDGRVRSASLVQDAVLKRNTPSLLYAAFQHTQFWDGRAKSMTAQIKDVLFNPLEMGGTPAGIVNNLKRSSHYALAFSGLSGQGTNAYLDKSAAAIAAFVAELNPLNSPFDRYLAGDVRAIDTVQVKGFNLFMGKAQCATCHFLPYFNSLVPPFYDRSEVEVLGTTSDDNFSSPKKDSDRGRADLFNIHYYEQAFKTPTVRNTAQTGPYMHHGKFKTLENVIEFYNQGGAAGLGIKTPDQTLSSRPLNLSKSESHALVQFIHSLTDSNINILHENN